MISKSDLLILVLASSALAVGIYRWHTNTQDVSAITIPASSRVVVEPVNAADQADPNLVGQVSKDVALLSGDDANASNSNQVIVQTIAEPDAVQGIVVESSSTSDNAVSVGIHQVRSGDYLGKIAKQYDTDVQTLRDMNGINGTVIQIGQDILYPL